MMYNLKRDMRSILTTGNRATTQLGAVTCTLSQNYTTYLRHIPWADLSTTLQDALSLAADLGYQYIWIDRLCIIQDDLKDWESEASQMADIYNGSDLTIAASTGASADDGLQLAFNMGLPEVYIPPVGDRPAALVRIKHNGSTELSSLSLYTRGWIFQETTLSRRVLHLGTQQFFWQCQTCYVSEDEILRSTTTRLLNLQETIEWHELVFQYSGKNFTFERDRIAALAGVVVWFGAKKRWTPLLGLWCEDLAWGLNWGLSESTLR